MNRHIWVPSAIKLCGADMTSGFISLDPVMADRNELVEIRLQHYCEQLQAVSDRLVMDSGFNAGEIHTLLPLAAELTGMDIASGVISVAPVLYDRDEKIGEHLCHYFSLLHKQFDQGHEVASAISQSDDKQRKELLAGSDNMRGKVFPSPASTVAKGKKRKKKKR